jgi:hypothetical protein
MTKTQSEIESLRGAINNIHNRIMWLAANEAWINELSARCHISPGYDAAIFFHDANRADVEIILRNVRGGFKKMPEDDTVSYSRINVPAGEPMIYICRAQPPASCRIVEEKVEIKAQTITRRKLVCSGHEDKELMPIMEVV